MFQRDIFINTVLSAMEKDKDIYFLSADFGAPALDKLRQQYPNNFIHCGISEQAMIDVATGLALEGKKVLYQRSTTVDDAGDEMMMVMHAFSAGEQNTIMISSYYPKAEENKYLPLIEKSVLSARLRE